MKQKTAPPTAVNESELIARLHDRERTEGAFREVVQQYGPILFHHLMRMIQERSDVDDVLQNTFVKAFQNIGRFRGDSKLLTWLYRIATNEALTHLRKVGRRSQRFTGMENVGQLANGMAAGTDFDGDAAQAALLKAIATLARQAAVRFLHALLR